MLLYTRLSTFQRLNHFFAFSEFLVDLMGAPGTLIPADVLSAKDTSFMSYHPKLSKLPNHQATNDAGVAYSKPNLSSGQSSAGQNNFSSGKESEKTGPLPSLHNGRMATGVVSSGLNKRVPSSNQMDHIPSLAIGTSLYKGGRGPNAAGDCGRMNVNLVPYGQKNHEDPKNLFSDLNPFHIKGSGKASLQGSHARKKFDELQQPKDNLASGRPPVPALRKNSLVYNEVSKKNEVDFAESLFPKSNQAAGNHNLLSIPSTSSAAPEKRPSKFYSTYGENDKGASAGNNLVSAEGGFNRLSLEDDRGSAHKETYQSGGGIQQNDESNVTKEYAKNVGRMHDHGNNQQDGFVGTNLKYKDQEYSTSSVNSVEPQVDPVIDDVSECEIPWEDLVIGERIGLGIKLVCVFNHFWCSTKSYTLLIDMKNFVWHCFLITYLAT